MHKVKFILLTLLITLCGNFAHAADDTPACITAIGNDKAAFVDVLKNKILKGKEFNQKFVDQRKHEIYNLVAANIETHCIDVKNLADFNTDIVDATTLKIPFQMDGKYYKLKVNVDTLFSYVNLPAAVMVTDLRNKMVGDVILKTDVKQDYFFSGQCSDHWVRVNIDNDVPVNKAGQSAFPTFSDSEFFIDFPFGKNNRAFPGLIIAAKKGIGGSEQVVWYQNYKTARENAKKFAAALQNTACSNDMLAVDVVSLTTVPIIQEGKKGWAIGGGVVGGTMVTLGILGGTIASGATAGILGGIAALASNPVGWIIAAVAATGATVYAIAPKSLADLEQVMVMDGPYLIR